MSPLCIRWRSTRIVLKGTRTSPTFRPGPGPGRRARSSMMRRTVSTVRRSPAMACGNATVSSWSRRTSSSVRISSTRSAGVLSRIRRRHFMARAVSRSRYTDQLSLLTDDSLCSHRWKIGDLGLDAQSGSSDLTRSGSCTEGLGTAAGSDGVFGSSSVWRCSSRSSASWASLGDRSVGVGSGVVMHGHLPGMQGRSLGLEIEGWGIAVNSLPVVDSYRGAVWEGESRRRMYCVRLRLHLPPLAWLKRIAVGYGPRHGAPGSSCPS